MWISEETARARINGSQNILNRINRDEDSPADYPVDVPALPPEHSPSDDLDAHDPIDGEFRDVESFGLIESAAADDPIVAAILHSMRDSGDEPSEEVVKALMKSVTAKKATHLTKQEAADAAVVGQLTSFGFAGQLFDKTGHHVRQVARTGTQTHVKDAVPTLRDLIEGQRTKVRDLAFQRLGTVLECLSADKIKKVEKARDLSNIAVQLATVADRMLPKEMQGEDNVHFHIMRPEVKQESSYEVVEVGAER